MPLFDQLTARERLVFLVILLIAVGLRVGLWTGVSTADDLHLASASLRWLDEGFHIPDRHLSLRVGLSLPLAAVFAMFGVGEWQMAVIPMLSSLSLILTSAYIARHFFGPLCGLFAAIAAAFFPLDILFSGQFYPDIPFGAISAGAVALFLKGRSSSRPALYAVLSGLVWGYAYLVKIEAVFLGVVYLALFLRGPDRRYVIYAGLACFAVFMAENLFYWVYTDQFLYRVKTIMESSNQSAGDIKQSTRIGEQFTLFKSWFITFYSFGLHYYLAVLGMVLLLIRRPAGYGLILSWIGIMVLWLQFGGNPFSENYIPKTKLLRYSSYMTAPVMVAAAYALTCLYQSRRPQFGLVALIGLLSAGLFFSIFGMVSAERETASKIAFHQAIEADYTPLYMDHRSYAIADFLLRGEGEAQATMDIRRGSIGPAQAAQLLSSGEVSATGAVYMLVNPPICGIQRMALCRCCCVCSSSTDAGLR